ncbi:hypothetical protein V8E51_012630 [Hyaloscypha variabilis]
MNAVRKIKFPLRATPPGLNTISRPHQLPSDAALAAATSFPQFPKLPAELCLRIWYFAAHVPRTITLRGGHDFFLHLKHNGHTIPAVLHTSHDSRIVALKFYQRYYNIIFTGGGFFINYATDTLLLWDNLTIQALYPEYLFNRGYWVKKHTKLEQNLKFLAVAGHYPTRAYDHWQKVLARFWRVEEVLIEGLRPAYDDALMRAAVQSQYLSQLNQQWMKTAGEKKIPNIRLVDEEEMIAMRMEEEENWKEQSQRRAVKKIQASLKRVN